VSAAESELLDIPMNDWSQERLEAGVKTATARTERYGDPGDRFQSVGRVYELTHVVKVPLKTVAEHFYAAEGAESPAEYREVWNDIHYRRGYEPDWMVWLHLFRDVGPDLATDGGRRVPGLAPEDDAWEPEPAPLRDGETAEDSHARRTAEQVRDGYAALAAEDAPAERPNEGVELSAQEIVERTGGFR